MPHWDSVEFEICQFGLSQIQQFELSQIQRPSLKHTPTQEEEVSQGESLTPAPTIQSLKQPRSVIPKILITSYSMKHNWAVFVWQEVQANKSEMYCWTNYVHKILQPDAE